MSLTDLATVKNYIGISGTNSDSVLTGLIGTQSQAFLDETGRTTFDSASYNEVRDGHGSDIMQLAYFPVSGFTSLQIDSNVIPLSTAWNMRGYQWNALGKVTLICGYYFCSGRNNVLADYTAGYLPDSIVGELQTIPSTPGPYSVQVVQPNWRSDGGVAYFVGGGALMPVLTAPSTGQYFVMGNGGYLFAAGDQAKQVQISYTAAGYPSDLVGAVNEMVLLRYRQKDQMNVSSVKIGDSTTTYSNADYPKDVWRVIKKYKRYFHVPGF